MQAADPLVPARAGLFNQMRAISDPNLQLEVLAYDLTASELNAFAEFQDQRQNNSASFGQSAELAVSCLGERLSSKTI